MTSTSASQQRSQPVSAAAIVTHGRVDVHEAEERVRALAESLGVTLVDDPAEVDLAIVLGGDGTMLRTLAGLIGTNVPVIGANYGRVGFLTSIRPESLEESLRRVFEGDYDVIELPTLQAQIDGEQRVAVNDVIFSSSVLGRMIELSWAVGGDDLGMVPCDGMICATPTGSTAYNLSNGGPVLVRGLDAMAVTFIAPHSLHARPLVVPRGLTLTVRSMTADVPVAVLVDGHRVADMHHGDEVAVSLCEQRTLLATLPETTFFTKYGETFAS